MRAMRIGDGVGLDRLYLDQTIHRDLEDGEIDVRVHASSLNYSDYGFCSGMLPVARGRIPLVDGAGEVIAIGGGVTDFAVGDRVAATFFPNWQAGPPSLEKCGVAPGSSVDGFAAERVVMPASAFTPAPQGWTHEEAATLTCAGATAFRALVTEGHLQPEEWVLVQGTGGVSLYALQIAKAMGARVIATSSNAAKLDRLRDLGADEVINYREVSEWGDRAFEIAGGGIDHIVDVGGEATLSQSMRAVRTGGKIYVIGVLGGMAFPLSLYDMIIKQPRLQGLSVGSRASQAELIKGIDQFGIRPVLDRRFDLADLAAAFRYQESQQHFGKIIITL